ncbi:MAG: glycoside hydrolase family 15 protein [Limisphaerales bacterium]
MPPVRRATPVPPTASPFSKTDRTKWKPLPLLFIYLALTGPCLAVDAPNGPGLPSVWAPGSKDFVGTSATEASKVYFTGAQGMLTEVFYPSPDRVQNIDMEFLVEDAARTIGYADGEEKLQHNQTVKLLDKRAMIWEATTTANNRAWRITKTIFTDPSRPTVIERVLFQVLQPGKTVRDFNLFVLNHPGIDDAGDHDNSRTLQDGSRTMLVAYKPGGAASALAVSLPWKSRGGHPRVSNGFVGVNDGWTDLFGRADDRAMDWDYDAAYNGNVAQMGWLDFGANDGTSVTFDLALGFGPNEQAAMDNANATLSSNLDELQRTYIARWRNYCRLLNDQGGAADDQYYLACMTLKTMQDKSNGAMVAGLGTPWGASSGDSNNGGYHLVWARDLFKFASALIAAGDAASANRALNFLFDVQMQTRDGDNPYSRRGRFPQNTFDDGRSYWPGTQMDECSMPIILAWKLHRLDLWPKIRMAADFVAANGPATGEERWEEMGGYSPSTIAAEIAGLVCAADLASQARDSNDAARYLRTADAWRNNLANWTFTTNGFFGDGKYYIRIDTNRNPNNPGGLTFGNGAGVRDARDVVDGGFLELVRLGVMSPNDWTILETLPKYDDILKQSIPGKGDAWFRYNCDGYGEHNDGTPYKNDGRGRLWPIFTAERGMYEISRANSGAAGRPYLAALKHFSSPAGFIPEQIWNISANIAGWETDTPSNDAPGTATGSMRPLNWAMGEYISLLAAIKNGRNDAPSVVVKRYESDKPQTIVNFSVRTSTTPGQTVYLVGDHPQLGAWAPQSGVEMIPHSNSIWTATLSLPAGASLQYKYVKIGPAGNIVWEGSTNRRLTTPASGAVDSNTSLAGLAFRRE